MSPERFVKGESERTRCTVNWLYTPKLPESRPRNGPFWTPNGPQSIIHPIGPWWFAEKKQASREDQQPDWLFWRFR
jgi:hypothetical protein